MAFTLEEVVPWGRTFEEYGAMFALDAADLGKFILGCGDGPAAFNAGLTSRGGSVVSADPLYRFGTAAVAARIDQVFETVMDQTRRNRDEFVWTHIASLEELGRTRMNAMRDFLDDYEAGRCAGRYVCAGLPGLPFRDGAFDLALCSHFLFLYGEQLDLEFHVASFRELCRVAREVRAFPLLELGAKPSRHLDALTDILRAEGYRLDVVQVDYEFQRGGDRMLRLRGPEAEADRRADDPAIS